VIRLFLLIRSLDSGRAEGLSMIVRNADNQKEGTPPNAFLLFWLSASILLAILSFLVIPEQIRPVTQPMLAAVIATIVFLWILRFKEGTIPFFEIGVIYVAVVVVYTLYPMTGFIVNGLIYTPSNDYRLFSSRPTPDEIGTIGWYYAVHLLSFIVMYLLIRRRLPSPSLNFRMTNRTSFLIIVVFYVTVIIFTSAINYFLGVSEGSYIESYLFYKTLPPGIAMIIGLLTGARFTLEIAIFASLFSRYHKYRPLILIWLTWMVLTTFLNLWSRTELVLLLMAAAMIYHYLVRPFKLRWVVGGGLLVLALFVLLGLLRSGWSSSGATDSFNPFAYVSEFEVIFGNAYDWNYRLNNASVRPPPAFYLADLVIGIPKQIVPFEKIIPANWYVDTFYPEFAALGGGLAFGTICESILGAGWLDLVARGAALGFILAHIHRYCLLHRASFWVFVFYIWLSLKMYLSFRNTTFYPLYLFVYQFLWVMAGIKILATILTGSIFPKKCKVLSQSEIKITA